MAAFNHTKTGHKREAKRSQRMENLLQRTLSNTLGSRFRVLKGWKEKKDQPPINTDEKLINTDKAMSNIAGCMLAQREG